MVSVILEACEDSFGILGWMLQPLKHNPTLNATGNAKAIAHDLIEHQNGFEAMGPVCDELEALGALWYARGCTGALDGYYGPYECIARDVEWLYEKVKDGEPMDYIVPDFESCGHEEDIGVIIDRLPPRVPRGFRKAAGRWMCLGLSKIDKKFGNPVHAHDMFKAIENALQPFFVGEPKEGELLKLTYDINLYSAECCHG